MLSQDGDEMNNLTRNENTRKILQIDKNKSSMQKAKSDERKHNNWKDFFPSTGGSGSSSSMSVRIH